MPSCRVSSSLLPCHIPPPTSPDALLPRLLLPHLIPPPSDVLAGLGRRQGGSFIAPRGLGSFFRSDRSPLGLLKCVVLKAVRGPILNGGDTKTSGAHSAPLGSNFCFCWNYLPQSLPPCWKLLPGFDANHISAEIPCLPRLFPRCPSHRVLRLVQLVGHRAASPALGGMAQTPAARSFCALK